MIYFSYFKCVVRVTYFLFPPSNLISLSCEGGVKVYICGMGNKYVYFGKMGRESVHLYKYPSLFLMSCAFISSFHRTFVSYLKYNILKILINILTFMESYETC